MKLYPLKFHPIVKDKIWGGTLLNDYLPEDLKVDKPGEIWSISGVKDNVSIVENGALAGKSLKELIHNYKEQLLGKEVWEKFGNEFPLLIKFIDTASPLSVQVHPNDEQAKKAHQSFGKTEMWYIMQASQFSELIIGFKPEVDLEKFRRHLDKNILEKLLNYVNIQKGDAFYIPAGRVHAIGSEITLAEIQQTSDITYRIYDYNRSDGDGKKRDLHVEEAEKVMDLEPVEQVKLRYKLEENKFSSLAESPYFSTRIYRRTNELKISDNTEMRTYICTEGKATFKTNEDSVELSAFQSLLMPAEIKDWKIFPEEDTTLLEVRIP